MDSSQSDLEAIRRLLAELAARVYRIERQLGISVEPVPPPKPSAPAVPNAPVIPFEPSPLRAPYPLIPSGTPISRPSGTIPQKENPDLESRIGSHWLNRIGITAVLIGISYFLKFAFDSDWIGPVGRVSIGLLAGIGVIVWSERFRTRGYKAFSYSLKAVGIGALYLSLWAAFQVYQLIPSSAAFVMMLAVTASTAAMALAQDAQVLAAFALTGGFSTPLLLSTGENRELALFSYVAMLDVATLLLVIFRPWRRLLVMSYAGTLLLYIAWYSSYYSRSQLSLTLGFATLFFAIFATAPVVALQPDGEIPLFSSIPAVLAFVNAVAYFLQAYAMIDQVDGHYMAWFALALAAVYIFLSRQVHNRKLTPEAAQILYFLHLAVAVGFITVAIPIRLDANWITIGWFVEAGILLSVANRMRSDFLSALALIALILGVVRLLVIDNFATTQLIFNMRMATFAVAVAVLGLVAWFARLRGDDAARTVGAVALVALNALALIALSREVTDYYSRQIGDLYPTANGPTFRERAVPGWRSGYADIRHIQIERDFTYSALWMAYGAMLMIVGFVRRSAFVRWQALLLIAATIVKVFVYDLSELDRGYRIVSFIVLGVLLLAISFVYQRDWLQLSSRKRESDASRSSSAS